MKLSRGKSKLKPNAFSFKSGGQGRAKGRAKGQAKGYQLSPNPSQGIDSRSLSDQTISIESQKSTGFRADGLRQIAEAKLLRFKNRTTHRRYVIDMVSPEFTCICPVSGFPDFATIQIQYVPKDWCVELKSLKLYINQYRDQGIYHEDVTNKIMDDLVSLLDPWEIRVVADFQVRGNIKTVISATHTHPKVGAERLVVTPMQSLKK